MFLYPNYARLWSRNKLETVWVEAQIEEQESLMAEFYSDSVYFNSMTESDYSAI